MTDLIETVKHVERRVSTPSLRLTAISVAVAFAQAFIDEALREAAGGQELSFEAIVELGAALHQISEIEDVD